jgi:hypothetical protein
MSSIRLSGTSSGYYDLTVPAAAGTNSIDLSALPVKDSNGNLGIGTLSPSASHRLTLDKTSNYGGISFNQNGNQVGQIIQEGGTGNLYIDADSNSIGGGLIFRTTGGTTRMTVDGSGRVITPYQPAFRVGKTSADTSSGGTFIDPITFQQTDFNIGNHFSTSTHKFTAPVAGRYIFNWSVSVNRNGANYTGAYSYVNGAYLDWTNSFQYSAPSWFPHDACIIVNLAANDTFHIVLRHDSNATVDNSGWFSGYLLG